MMYHPDHGYVGEGDIARLCQDDPRVFIARLGGLLEWLCPRCNAMNRTHVAKPVARVECVQPGCRVTIGVGLAWASGPPSDPRDLPPFNARTCQPRPGPAGPAAGSGTYHNLNCDFTGPEPDGLSAIARAAGVIEWCCPRCQVANVSYADWLTGAVRCNACLLLGRVAARLLELGNARRRTPADWMGLQRKEDRLHRDRRLRQQRSLRVRRSKAMPANGVHNA